MKSHPLKVERELRGWSQSKVAEMLGTTTRTVIRWEQGEVIPYPYYREQLCAVFGKNAQQLGLVPESPPPQTYENEESMQIELELPPEISFLPDQVPQEGLLIDPAIPEMLGRAETLLGRDTLLDQVKHHLLEDNSSPLMALHGLPGIGKTALAVALAFNQEIQARFHDGILWAELGPQPNVLRQLARWAMLLGIPPSQVGNLHSREAWGKALQVVIGQRNLLLIIDNAWTAEDAFAFQVGNSQCSHLLTTRLPQVALAFAGEKVLSVPELEDSDSLDLLAHFVPQLIKQDPKGMQTLVRATGGLPLSLTLVGKYLAVQALTQQPRRLQAALAEVHDTELRLRVSVPIAPGERTSNLPADIPPSLYAAIAVSDQQLSPQAHAALCALAVFAPKPASFSEAEALAVIQQPVEILDELWDAGLLESSGTEHYSLHQTIVDYARALGNIAATPQQQANSSPNAIDGLQQEMYASSTTMSSPKDTSHENYGKEPKTHSLTALFSFQLSRWKSGLRKDGIPTFRPAKQSLAYILLMVSIILLVIVLICFPFFQTFLRQSPKPSTPAVTSYGPPPYGLNIQNTDPSLNDIALHLQNTFNAVYPQLVNRFSPDPASAAQAIVTVTLTSNLSSPARISGMMITINSDWLRQHPNDVGLLTHELTLLVQTYPFSAPTWFSDGMADYTRSVYGPADDDWSLPENVQPQDNYTQGGGVAARFLLWLEQHTRLDIVDQLNHAIQTRQSFSAAFHLLTHHTVDELWKQYQAHPNIALTPQQIYKTATSRKPLYYQRSPFDVQCEWVGGLHLEALQGLFMSNFVLQADMTFVQGDGGGGFMFRSSDSNNDTQYRFRVSPDGSYDLINQTHALTTGFTPVVKQGLNQTNRLTIIAQKQMIYVYINGQLITQADDNSSSYGTIAEMAYDKTTPADVQFANMQVF